MNLKSLFIKYVLSESLCIYSGNAKLVFADQFLSGKEDNLDEIFDQFRQFDGNHSKNEFDGFVIGFKGEKQNPNSVIDFGANLLYSLVDKDKGTIFAKELIGGINKENWWYKFGETRYFIICFSSCYPENSPRYVAEKSLSFFMFQPVHSFDRKSVPVGTSIPQKTRDVIRAVHKKNNKPYDPHLIQTLFEGQKVFHGLEGDHVYDWYKYIDSKSYL
jgi:hypothetical protein